MEATAPKAGKMSGKLWIGIGVALVVGLLLGWGVVSLTTPATPPQKTFTVVAYHWGFAIYDEQGQEIPKIEVARGTQVTLLVIGAEALSHELHEVFEDRTIEAWENNTAFGNKNASEIHEEIEDAELQGLVNHSVSISGYGVNVVTDVDSASPKRATFTADTVGTFDILCLNECGWGHQWMKLSGGFVVT